MPVDPFEHPNREPLAKLDQEIKRMRLAREQVLLVYVSTRRDRDKHLEGVDSAAKQKARVAGFVGFMFGVGRVVPVLLCGYLAFGMALIGNVFSSISGVSELVTGLLLGFGSHLAMKDKQSEARKHGQRRVAVARERQIVARDAGRDVGRGLVLADIAEGLSLHLSTTRSDRAAGYGLDPKGDVLRDALRLFRREAEVVVALIANIQAQRSGRGDIDFPTGHAERVTDALGKVPERKTVLDVLGEVSDAEIVEQLPDLFRACDTIVRSSSEFADALRSRRAAGSEEPLIEVVVMRGAERATVRQASLV